MKRRTMLGSVAGGIALTIAGCSDIIDGEVSGESEPARVDEATVEENGYEYHGMDSYEVHEKMEVMDEEIEATISSWGTMYGKDGEFEVGDFEADFEEQVAGFSVVTTPSESVMGQEINPVGHMDTEDLMDYFQSFITDNEIEQLETVGEFDVTVLEQGVTGDEIDGVVIDENGEEMEMKVYVTEVKNEEDIILGVGVHPIELDFKNELLTMTENIEHPVPSDE